MGRDVWQLLRKLEPLMPREVAQWRRAYSNPRSPRLQGMLERKIARVAEEVLGNVEEKALLSLPPKSLARGALKLGNVVYERERWSAGISEDELLRNMAIFGMSGAGKTNAMFHLLIQLSARKIPFLFLDWKRTARHLLPQIKAPVAVYTAGRRVAPLLFNPFVVPPGLEPEVYLQQVVDVMANAFTLGDGVRSVLQKAIAACYAAGNQSPTAEDLLAEIEAIPDRERVRGWKISARRALESLALSGVGTSRTADQEEASGRLLSGKTIVELDALSQGAKDFLVPVLCLWLYYVQLASPEREKLQLVIIVEEAHNVLQKQERRAREPAMEMLLRQCREIGISMVIVDQQPNLISSVVLANTYTTICLNQKNPADVSKAAAVLGLGEHEKHWLGKLPLGQGIVRLQDRWRRPFLVQFPLVEVEKGCMTDARLREYLEAGRTRSGMRGFLKREFGRRGRVRGADYVLGEGDVKLLQDVLLHKPDAVRDRYKRLGMSASQGTRRKDLLVQSGFLTEHEVEIGNTRKTVLRLTASARAILGMDRGAGAGGRADGRAVESVIHEYWKQYYAELYGKKGHEVSVEAPRAAGRRREKGGGPGDERGGTRTQRARTAPERGLGRVDVLARNSERSIAIEIETGKSRVVENVRRDLQAGFEEVLVVATDRKASRIVERQLGKAGLLGVTGRVKVALAGMGTQ